MNILQMVRHPLVAIQWWCGSNGTLCAILGGFDSYRKFVGGTWAHYFMEDGLVEIWDYVPSNKTVFDILPKVYYGLQTENHPYKLIHTKTGVTPA